MVSKILISIKFSDLKQSCFKKKITQIDWLIDISNTDLK